MSRPVDKQLQTQYWLLSLFTAQIAAADESGELGERVDKLREGKAKTEQRIRDLGGEVPE